MCYANFFEYSFCLVEKVVYLRVAISVLDPYRYHPIIVSVHSSIQYEIVFRVSVWYETLYRYETYIIRYRVYRAVQPITAFYGLIHVLN